MSISGIAIGAAASFAVVLFVVVGAALVRGRAARARRSSLRSGGQRTEPAEDKLMIAASTGRPANTAERSPDLVTSLPSPRPSPYGAYDKGNL